MKTAVQQAIGLLEQLQYSTGSSKAIEIDILKSLLPTEREHIEKAWDDGLHKGYTGDRGDANDYYNKTYGNETRI